MHQEYFNFLNYTLGNEDTTIEYKLCCYYGPNSILSVCGSGGRAFPLLMENTRKICLFDVSAPQLKLAKLRQNTYQKLDYQNFLRFWGYYNNSKYSDVDSSLRLEVIESLSDDRDFWLSYFKNFNWESILYHGKWEKTFILLAKFSRLLLGKRYCEIFNYEDIKKQREYYKNKFPIKRWKLVIYLLGNKSVFNALLYGGSFVKKNIKESFYKYYFNAFDRLFNNVLAKESFFLNLCFFGKIKFNEGNPIEASEKVFYQIKKKLNDGVFVEYKNLSLKEINSTAIDKYDFVSLSNVPSYLSLEEQRDLLKNLDSILNSGAVVVVRYYLNVGAPLLDGFSEVSTLHQKLIDEEKVQMYQIKIYKKN